ncbi:MAG: PD40 domain-containing protein, partial [Crocinitomicaceae bacterium]|nr:PD40 domain-containing protein [Crocinitomicaceae bacterium]
MKLILIILSLCLYATSYGQNIPNQKKQKGGKWQKKVYVNKRLTVEQKGDKWYKMFDYPKAVKYYELSDSLSTDGLRKLTDAYEKIYKYDISLLMYRELMKREDLVAEDYFNFANSLKINMYYKEADIWMKKFHEMSPKDMRGKSNISVLDESASLLENRGVFEVSNVDFNSEQQEFGACFYRDQLVYSANAPRKGIIIKLYNWSNQTFLDLYVVHRDSLNEFSRHEFASKFNKKFHEGTLAFTDDYERMYYTSNNYEEESEDGTSKLQLYITEMDDLGEWKDEVAFQHNNPEYSIGHPWVSKDGRTLYFSSDKPGGYGGVDLYTSTMDADSVWSTPENLGPTINTEGDEMFPFYIEEHEIFTFSSNGHFGLGGLDIYSCSLHKGVYGKINNFGQPLNSSHDDFGLIFTEDMA